MGAARGPSDTSMRATRPPSSGWRSGSDWKGTASSHTHRDFWRKPGSRHTRRERLAIRRAGVDDPTAPRFGSRRKSRATAPRTAAHSGRRSPEGATPRAASHGTPLCAGHCRPSERASRSAGCWNRFSDGLERSTATGRALRAAESEKNGPRGSSNSVNDRTRHVISPPATTKHVASQAAALLPRSSGESAGMLESSGQLRIRFQRNGPT